MEDAKQQRASGVMMFDEELDDDEQFFIQYNNVPVGFDVHRGRTFVTVPRRRYGIPSTLNVVEEDARSGLPLLKPYPDVGSTSSLVSVYRPRVDACDRLWVVDTGLLEVPDHNKQVKPAQIVIFDLKSNKEILRYELRRNLLVNGTTSGLTSITVDVTSTTCEDAHAYINDLKGGLIVFSLRQRDSWMFAHSTFDYDEGASDFFVANANIGERWQDGLFSIALSQPDRAGVRTAYYHPFVSTLEYSVTTDVLQNKSSDFENSYKLCGVRGAWSQSGSHAYHGPTRTLFFANVALDGVLCWNTDTPLTGKNTAIIAQHHKRLVYISDLKVVGDEVWVLVNQMPRFVYDKLNTADVNFTIMKGRVSDLIKNTVCEGNNL